MVSGRASDLPAKRPDRKSRTLRPKFSGNIMAKGAVGRSATSAATATAADFILATFLVHGAGVVPAVATFVGCVLGGFTNFLINRRWAYRAEGRYGPQAVRYVFVSGSSAVFNSGLVAVGMLIDGAGYVPVWLVARALVFVAWTHPRNRDFVFGARSERSGVNADELLTETEAEPETAPGGTT